jgi:hypothetical protein
LATVDSTAIYLEILTGITPILHRRNTQKMSLGKGMMRD